MGRSDLPKAAIETERCISESRRGEYGLNYSSDNDLSHIAVCMCLLPPFGSLY